MSERREPTPVALYVRVSSDRQDVDLSVAAQLRALKAHADKERLPGRPRGTSPKSLRVHPCSFSHDSETHQGIEYSPPCP